VNGSFAAYFAKRKGIPYIIQPHGSLPTTIGMKKMKKYYDIFVGNNILKNASKLIALNKMEEEQYIDMNIEKNKIEIAPNGIDLAQYTYLPKKNSFKKKYGINLNERIILYLGRINKIKGIDLLIEAFEELSKEMNDIRLVIVGPDNGFVSTLKNRMETLNIQHKVLFTGPLYEKNKLEAYVDADVLVYPSSFEIFGLVPLESLMCGTPVIVTDNCGCAEIIKKSESGYLVKYGDVEDLKQKMQILIKCNSKENLAAKGKKYIENNLALDVIAHTMEMIYRKCDDNC
jgi:glycosyltransferase involved in cell wall biosynthesis